MASKNVQLTLKNVRLSFPHLFEPQEMESEKGGMRYVYNANFLIPRTLADGTPNPQVKQVQDAMVEALQGTWPGQKKVISADRRCFRSGEVKNPDTEEMVALYEGYAGHMVLVANQSVKGPTSPNPVQLLGPKKTAKDKNGKPCFPRLSESDGMLYAGAYVDVIVTIYGYNGAKSGNPDRINASLDAVKFVRHGEALGAKPVDADSMFDEEDGDAFDGGDDDEASPFGDD